MKGFVYKTILAIAMVGGMVGCGMPSTPGGAWATDSSMVSDTGKTMDSAVDTDARIENNKVDADSLAGDLAGLEGMNLESSMEIDDFRSRLEHDWGDVHNILRASGAEFKREGEGYLVMKGEVKQGGFPWTAILIVDLVQNAVFAAQFDGENKRIDQFEEEIEGLKQPVPLTQWVKNQR